MFIGLLGGHPTSLLTNWYRWDRFRDLIFCCSSYIQEYNEGIYTNTQIVFNNRKVDLQKELESGQRHPDHEKQTTKYFEIKTTPIRETKGVAIGEAMAEAKCNVKTIESVGSGRKYFRDFNKKKGVRFLL